MGAVTAVTPWFCRSQWTGQLGKAALTTTKWTFRNPYSSCRSIAMDDILQTNSFHLQGKKHCVAVKWRGNESPIFVVEFT